MKRWFRGKRGGFFAFIVIAGLIAGGLGWVTAAALRLEHEQLQSLAEAELQGKLRQALWQLDSVMMTRLSHESSRPFTHYSALSVPTNSVTIAGKQAEPGTVTETSPLLKETLPDWILLHFSTGVDPGWWSPQVLSGELQKNLAGIDKTLTSDPGKGVLLDELKALRPETMLAAVKCEEHRQEAIRVQCEVENRDNNKSQIANWSNIGNNINPMNQSQDAFNAYAGRQGLVYGVEPQTKPNQQTKINQRNQPTYKTPWVGNLTANNEHLLKPNLREKSREVTVSPGPWTALWVKTSLDRERLVLARRVTVGDQQICQGVLLNWQALQEQLTTEVHDLFPAAKFQPVRPEPSTATDKNQLLLPPHPERTMAALPIELDPGLSLELEDPGWTPLRIGLALSWTAALLALAAVGLGGWSLIDLSQRRIRFVSTVTHELRTPLTTLRLYLDMLTGGMVKDEKQKEEYLHTLNAETDRLNRLVSNVLDFSRLENHQPGLEMTTVPAAELLEQVSSTWANRCKETDKELIVENTLPAEATLTTDVKLVQQLLGNLIDNACKYSRTAEDKRLWMRARAEGTRTILEVEDRGPGVPKKERRSIFLPFSRGSGVDAVAGGVGLGLALSQRWVSLLGGTLTVHPGADGKGACFRVELVK